MTEYGLFNDEGCLEAQMYSVEEAEGRRAEYITEGLEEPEDITVRELCPDHEGQPKDGCEECNAEPDEDDDEDYEPRHTVAKLGDGYFAVIDNVTGLYQRVSSSRERAQKRADELNSQSATPAQNPGPSLDDYAKASRIIQSLIPGVRR